MDRKTPSQTLSTSPPKRSKIKTPDLFRLAALNLSRHGSRTAINATGIAMATAALVFFLSFFRGTYQDIMFDAVIGYDTAHIQIQSSSFDDGDPDTWLEGRSLLTAEVPEGTLAAPIRAWAPRLLAPAWAGDGARKAGVILAGADYGLESECFDLDERLVEGAFGGGVLIGKKIAEVLGLHAGSEIRIQATDADGAPNLDSWTIGGVFSSGYPPVDRSLILMPLEEAGAFLGATGSVNKLYLRASSLTAADRLLSETADPGLGLCARSWKSYAVGLVEDAKKDGAFYAAFVAILIFLSVSTVAGTMQVTVFERKREIGMLRATGWLPKEIGLLFMLEALAIGILGTAVGMALGGGGALLLQVRPIPLDISGSSMDIPEFSFTCRSAPADFLLAAAAGALSALAAGISPARRAAKTDILVALSEA